MVQQSAQFTEAAGIDFQASPSEAVGVGQLGHRPQHARADHDNLLSFLHDTSDTTRRRRAARRRLGPPERPGAPHSTQASSDGIWPSNRSAPTRTARSIWRPIPRGQGRQAFRRPNRTTPDEDRLRRSIRPATRQRSSRHTVPAGRGRPAGTVAGAWPPSTSPGHPTICGGRLFDKGPAGQEQTRKGLSAASPLSPKPPVYQIRA